MITRAESKRGMTLIELLVVIAVISLFVSIGVVTAQSGQARARDAERKVTLQKIKSYLALYKDNNGSYPSTGGNWYSSESGDVVSNNGGNWIPGLATYIGSLPKDPLGGASSNSASVCTTLGWKRAYLYSSDGRDYILLSNCAPERSWTSSNPFYDSNRPTSAFKVCTPGACGWMYTPPAPLEVAPPNNTQS